MWGSTEKIDNVENKYSPFWKLKEELNNLQLCISTLREKEVNVWVAPKIPPKLRMGRLFPDWVPTNEKEMNKYIVQIKVPIITAEWKSTTISFNVHRKLKNEFMSAFQDIKKAQLKEIKKPKKERKINPINPDRRERGSFNWRSKRDKPEEMSIHSYWWAIDINSWVNKWHYWTEQENNESKNSPYYITPEFAEIMKKHGFYWWWDRSDERKDPMHFSYTEKPDIV